MGDFEAISKFLWTIETRLNLMSLGEALEIWDFFHEKYHAEVEAMGVLI